MSPRGLLARVRAATVNYLQRSERKGLDGSKEESVNVFEVRA